jgi:hypothetical protein
MYSLSGGYLESWAHPAAASRLASMRHALNRIKVFRVRIVIVIPMEHSFPGFSVRLGG